MADLLDFGWLPDAIVRAIVEFIRSVLVSAMNVMFNFGLKPLLTIEPAVVTSGPVTAAWDDVFRLSIALLPIMIAAGLLVLPFSERSDTTLWTMVARVVAVIVFIAISQPLFGFLIEASNAVTDALAPPTFVLTFTADLGGSWGATLGSGIEVVALTTAVPLMLIATILASVLLALRQFVVITVLVGAPLFAVLWYANWGPMKAISDFAAIWLRMGVYALLVGPIIALVMRVFTVIATGGMSSSASGDVASFYVSAALAMMFPIILFIVVWKTIGWAGQPLGVDAAFTTTVAAVIAATGVGAVAVGAGVGSGAASSASSASAGGGSGGSAGASGSVASTVASTGESAAGTATDPSAGTANSSVGGTMRNSIADALSTREPPAEEGVDTAPGMFSANKDALRRRIGNVPGIKKAGVTAGQTGSAMKKAGSKAKNVGIAGARKAAGTDSIDAHRRRISESMDAATEADANRQFLAGAYQAGELNISEAADRGLLTEAESPAEGVSTVSPDAAGRVTYPTAAGGEATININDRAQQLGEQAHTLREDASKSARGIKRIRTAQAAAKAPGQAAVSTGRAGKRVGSAGVRTGKAGGVVFAGAMTQNPWAAYQIGKRGGKHLIGPGTSPSEDASEDVDMEQSAELHSPEHAPETSHGDTVGGESTETR